MRDRLPSWLDRWIEPSPAVSGAEARRRARYTALSLLLIVPLGLAAVLLVLLFPTPGMPPGSFAFWVMTSAVALLAALYPVSRGPRHALAAYLTLAVTSAAIWGDWALALPHAPSDAGLYFLALPLFVASLLAGARGAALVGGANVLAAAAALALAPDARPAGGSPLTLPFFLLMVSGLVVYAARARERDLEELERLAGKLRENETARVRMLNAIAHDIGSPLTPIQTIVDLAAPERPIPAERIALLQRNLSHVNRLVSDLRDLARMEAGVLRFERVNADLRPIVQAAADAFRADAAARGVRIDLALDEPLPALVDPQRVTQVLYNLLTNALKFTPAGGSVLIEARAAGGEARLAVRDSGRGLTRDEMERLFRPFSQAHARSEVKEPGTGLGLYISRGIAEAHGGRIWVESDGPGKGATFTLALPAAAPAVVAA